MVFWSIAILMCGLATFTILLPLSRGRNSIATTPRGPSLYQKQMHDLDAQLLRSDVDHVTLEQEKAELVRRIIRADQGSEKNDPSVQSYRGARTLASLASIAFIPLVTIIMYLQIGAPGISDVPLSKQKSIALNSQNVEQLVIRAEKHLQTNPDDPRGWRVLANVYGKLNRPSDHARALSNLIRIEGVSPNLLADMGEALTVAKQNIIPVRAQDIFEHALKLDPKHRKARFYFALSLEQEGKFQPARELWLQLQMLDKNQPAWQKLIGERLAIANRELGLVRSGPKQSDIDAAAQMSGDDRSVMIKSMVAGLAAKLKQNPDNLAGWQRLLRAYNVLGDTNAAKLALSDAEKQFADRPTELKSLREFSQSLKRPEGANQ